MGMQGTLIIEELMDGKRKLEDLGYEEIDLVLQAYDTRNYVPDRLIGTSAVHYINHSITKEQVAAGEHTQEEYDRDHVKHIIEYLKSI